MLNWLHRHFIHKTTYKLSLWSSYRNRFNSNETSSFCWCVCAFSFNTKNKMNEIVFEFIEKFIILCRMHKFCLIQSRIFLVKPLNSNTIKTLSFWIDCVNTNIYFVHSQLQYIFFSYSNWNWLKKRCQTN